MYEKEVTVDENSVQDEPCGKHVCYGQSENSSFLHGDESEARPIAGKSHCKPIKVLLHGYRLL